MLVAMGTVQAFNTYIQDDGILRADAMQGWLINAKSVAGGRLELRRKF